MRWSELISLPGPGPSRARAPRMVASMRCRCLRRRSPILAEIERTEGQDHLFGGAADHGSSAGRRPSVNSTTAPA